MTLTLSVAPEPHTPIVFASRRSPSVDDAGKVNAAAHRFPSGNNSTAVCDPYAIRRKHPEHWRAFIRAHFADVTAVKWAFGVDYATAKHWWNGTGAAQGWAVEYAIKTVPNAAQWLVAA